MTTGGCNVLDLPAALPPSLCVLAPPAHGPEPHTAPDRHPDPRPGQVLDRLLDGTGHIVAADLNAAQVRARARGRGRVKQRVLP